MVIFVDPCPSTGNNISKNKRALLMARSSIKEIINTKKILRS